MHTLLQWNKEEQPNCDCILLCQKKTGNIIQWPKSCSRVGCRLTLHLCSPRWSRTICLLGAMAGDPFHFSYVAYRFDEVSHSGLRQSDPLQRHHQCSSILCSMTCLVESNLNLCVVWWSSISVFEQIHRSSHCYLTKDAECTSRLEFLLYITWKRASAWHQGFRKTTYNTF